jgi:CheY-like chemotaxis protein
MAHTLALCLDRWTSSQVDKAIEVTSSIHSSLPALPRRVKSSPAPEVQSETHHDVSEDPSPTLPDLPIQRQQSEQQSLRTLKSTEAKPPQSFGSSTQKAQVAPFLIVDDNEINLKLLSTYLTRKSYPFATATDGIFAVEAYKAARGNFSCVFMDIQMPRMDGISATRAIREYEREEKLEPVTVVALTGLATDEKQKEAEASGVNNFFAKPVRLKELNIIMERTARLLE